MLRPDLLKVPLSPCFRLSSLLLLSLLPLVGGLAASAEGRASRMSVNEAALPSAPPTRSSSAEASAVSLARLSESRSTSPSNRKVVKASLSTLPSGFQDTTVVSGLDLPIALSFAPDGKVFVAEQRGIIKEFSSLSDTNPSVYADLGGCLELVLAAVLELEAGAGDEVATLPVTRISPAWASLTTRAPC